jgi:hypothetical protein
MTAEGERELTTAELILAYQLLKDQGLGLDDGDYSLGNMTKMKHAVRIVNEFASGLPEQVKVDCIMRYFKSFREIESFRNMFKPSIKRDMERQLLSEQEEQKRLTEARNKALEKKIEQEQLDLIIHAEPPPEPPKMPIGTREDLQNMILNLDRKYFTLN